MHTYLYAAAAPHRLEDQELSDHKTTDGSVLGLSKAESSDVQSPLCPSSAIWSNELGRGRTRMVLAVQSQLSDTWMDPNNMVGILPEPGAALGRQLILGHRRAQVHSWPTREVCPKKPLAIHLIKVSMPAAVSFNLDDGSCPQPFICFPLLNGKRLLALLKVLQHPKMACLNVKIRNVIRLFMANLNSKIWPCTDEPDAICSVNGPASPNMFGKSLSFCQLLL